MNYSSLYATIAQNIYENHLNQVTAKMVKAACDSMVASLGYGYQFRGAAAPGDAGPGNIDQRVFYIASTPGTYSGFGGLTLAANEVALLKWDTEWHKETLDIPSKTQIMARLAAQDAQIAVQNGRLDGQDEEIADFEEAVQNQVDNYPMITINGNVTNAPDEEDITTDANDLLKFKNRSAVDGMGYKILRKGTGLTFAEQVTEANTIYEIRYDFDLGGTTVTIPAGCVLKFDCGNISNGTIIGQDTEINADLVKIFNTNVALGGSWNISEAYPEWFGAVGDGVSDDTQAVQRCIYISSILNITSKFTNNYALDSVLINSNSMIEGSANAAIIHIGNEICINVAPPDDIESYRQFLRCSIKNITIQLNSNSKVGLRINQCVDSQFENIKIVGTNVNVPDPTALTTKGVFVDGTSRVEQNKNSVYNNTYRKFNISNTDIGFDIDGVISDSKFYNIFVNNSNISLRAITTTSWNVSIDDSQFVTSNIGIHIEGVFRQLAIKGCNIENYRIYGIYKAANVVVSNVLILGNGIITTTTENVVSDLCLNSVTASLIALNHVGYEMNGTITGNDISGCFIATNRSADLSAKILNMNFCFKYNYKFGKDVLELLGNNYSKEYYTEKLCIGNNDYGVCELEKGENNLLTFYNGSLYIVLPTGVETNALYAEPLRSCVQGTHLFVKETNKPVWRDTNWSWIESDGAKANVRRSGTFAQKPSASDIYIGFRYFCTDRQTVEGATDGIEIIYKGNNVWVDALGRVVS